MDILLEFLKWLLIWAVVTGLLYIVFKTIYTLITKPNLRAYILHTIKDFRNMYYRYHV